MQTIFFKTSYFIQNKRPNDDFNIFSPVVVGRAQMPRAEEKLKIYIKESQPILPSPGRLKDPTTPGDVHVCV
jgi:hypothetical protein